MNNIDIYLKQNIEKPTYLFHGSPQKLKKLVPQQSTDSNNNINNVANAIFLFPSFLKATPYAFKDTIKEMNEHYDFIIPNNNEEFLMTIKDVEYIDEDIIGYIYVFKINDKMLKDERSYQYKCFSELEPDDIIKIKYSDYKKYYNYIEPCNRSIK